MKQYTTNVALKWSAETLQFTTPEAWAQGHSGQDIHSTIENGGNTYEVFIPEHSISRIDFSVSEGEGLRPFDTFCGESGGGILPEP